MSKMKTWGAILLVFLISVSLIAGCGGAKKDGAKPVTKKKYTLGTGGSGGVFYVLGAGMADIVNRNTTTMSITAQSTAATTESLNLISTGQLDFAFSLYDVAYFAQIGQREYKKKLENIRLVMFGHVGLFTPVVFQESPVKTIADLKGKTSPHSPGSLGKVLMEEAFKPWGVPVPPKPSALSYTEMAAALKDGTIDVMNYHGAHPASSIMDVSTVKPIRVLSQTEDSMKKILKDNPYWIRAIVPGKMYKGQDTDALTYGTPYCIVVNKNVPDEVVTQFLDIMLKNDLSKIHPEGKWYDKNHASYKNPPMVPFHPAAEKYLKEKGIIK